MARIIIVSKTRMQNEKVCVGGVDMDNRCSIRLFDEDGFHETINDCPYDILDLWDIEYEKLNNRPEPHTEDVCVNGRHFIKRCDVSIITRLNAYGVKFFDKHNSIFDVFDGALYSTDAGALYIDGEDVPSYSTCFWVCDKNLKKNKYSTTSKIKFDYSSQNNWYHIPYVGVEDIEDTIPKGTLLRLSLANWWAPEDSDIEERCYLQLSGVFPNALIPQQAREPQFRPSSDNNKVPKTPQNYDSLSTVDKTLSLFKKGMSPQQISQYRGYTIGTIYSHLAKCVECGDLSLESSCLVSRENIKKVQEFFKCNPYETSLKACFEYYGGKISYEDIHLVVADLKKL